MNKKKSKGLIVFNAIFYILLGLIGVFALYLEFFAGNYYGDRDLWYDFILIAILLVLVFSLFLVYKIGERLFPKEYGKLSDTIEEPSGESYISDTQLVEESSWQNIEQRKKKEIYFFEIIDEKYLKTTKVFCGIAVACFVPLVILSIVNFVKGINFKIPLLILVIVMAICLAISIFFIGRATFMKRNSEPKSNEYKYMKLGALQVKVDRVDENAKKRMEIFSRSLSFALGLGALVLFVFLGVFTFSAKFVNMSTFLKLLFGTLFLVVNLGILLRWIKLLKSYTFSKGVKL